jgi:periplasmic divalent cation tolerance protein
MPGADHHQVSTTTDSADAAASLARSAVAARLAACGQVVGPIRSIYRWAGKIDDAQEWLVVCKTTAARCDALVEHLRTHHTYDLPEIITTPVIGGNPAYLAWIDAETGTGP